MKIKTQEINGKIADIFYLDEHWNIVDESKATMGKIVFRDGSGPIFFVVKAEKKST